MGVLVDSRMLKAQVWGAFSSVPHTVDLSPGNTVVTRNLFHGKIKSSNITLPIQDHHTGSQEKQTTGLIKVLRGKYIYIYPSP